MTNYDYLNSLYKLPRSSDCKVEGVTSFGLPLYTPGKWFWYSYASHIHSHGRWGWKMTGVHRSAYVYRTVTKPVYGLRGHEWSKRPTWCLVDSSSYENPTTNSNWYWDENWSDWYTSGMGMDTPMEILTGSMVNQNRYRPRIFDTTENLTMLAWPSCTFRGTDVTLKLPLTVNGARNFQGYYPELTWPIEGVDFEDLHTWVYGCDELYIPSFIPIHNS